MIRILSLLTALLMMAACAPTATPSDPLSDLGAFRLGYNVVVADKMRKGPVSRDATKEEWEAALKDVVKDPVWNECVGRLVLLSDGDFSHFVATTTEISQHIKIDPKTGAVAKGALFNLESVPAEALFFAPVHVVQRPAATTRKGAEIYTTDCAAELGALVERHPVLQFGGNSTTGRGFCSLTLA